jgi:DNA-binding transcriptional LysR family regulator
MARTPVDYQLLAVFAAVAEEASFSKAARRLGIGKGTVSRAIASLEELLGTQLLHRTTHAVALSTAGTALYERTAHHLTALDQAVLKLPERAEQPSGLLRLTAPLDFGHIVLPEVLSHFSRRYPDVRFDVRLTNAHVDIVAEGFDVAIRVAIGKLKDSSLTARRLGSAGAGFYAAPSYVARRGKPKQIGEENHAFILSPAVVARWKLPREANLRFVCDDFFLVRELVRDGAGVGLLPYFVADPYVRDGLLEPVPVSDVFSGNSFFLLYPSSGPVPRKVAAFRDFLLERFKKAPLA